MKTTLDIRHDTKLHQEIMERLTEYVKSSMSARSADIQRFARYDKIADGFIAVPEAEATAQRNSPRHEYQTLVIPYSYSAMMAEIVYITTVFLSRTPLMQVQGQTADAQTNEMAMETFLHYQMRASGSLPRLFQWLRDSRQYGQGIISVAWEEETSIAAGIVYEQNAETGRREKKLLEREVVNYMGNRVYLVRPEDFIHDPNVGVAQIQEGEFTGEFGIAGRHKIMSAFESGEYIGANKQRFVETLGATGFSGKYWRRGADDVNPEHLYAARYDKQLEDHYAVDAATQGQGKRKPFHAEVLDIFVKLIPKEWGLNQSTKSQIYVFRVLNGEVLAQVRPLGCLHGKFPHAVAPGDIDLYRVSPVSTIERALPFEHTMNWLVNSHFYNVRKHLNNNLVIDPSRVMMQDLIRREPGGFIRAKPLAYGTDLRNAVHQLQVADVTRSHISDMQMIEQYGQQVLGINDNVMGQVHPGGRKTATEIRSSTSFSTNRLKQQAEFIGATGYADFQTMVLLNSQQYFNSELALKHLGMDQKDVAPWVNIRPETIAGHFMFEAIDGTIPVDRQGQAQIFTQLMMQMMQVDPQGMDVMKMFSFLGELLGFRNLPNFRVMQTMPDEQYQQQVQQGNLAPVNQAAPAPSAPQVQQ